MASFRKEILGQIERIDTGRIFTFRDLSFETEKTANVAVLLSEQNRKGVLVRVEKGAYYRPKKSVLGLGKLPVYQDEQFRYLTEKLNGYITGAYIYNKMGLTEQVATTITIATPNPVRRFRFKNLDIECVKAYCMVYPDESLVPYLRLLDAIKDMKRIPGTTGQDIYNRVKSQYFNGYSLPELEKSYLWRKVTRHVSERWWRTYWATSDKPYCKQKWQRPFFPRHGSTWIIKRHRTEI